MILTDEMLAIYVGGQLEIQNDRARYLFRGEIASAQIIDHGYLKFDCKWMAKAREVPGKPGDQVFPLGGWVADNNLGYQMKLDYYAASDIGNGRLAFFCDRSGELTILYPSGGSRLDPSRVEGLVLS